MVPSPPSVIRRGRNFFKQRDVTRAVRSARAAGLAVGGVEVVTKDGTTIRILSKDTAEHGGNDLDNWIAKRGKDARPA
jgi:hypothetical protein